MKQLAFALLWIFAVRTVTANAETQKWRSIENPKQLVARLLPQIQVQYDAQNRLIAVKDENGNAFDLSTFGHPVFSGNDGYWSSPAMKVAGEISSKITKASEAEDVIAALHTIGQGAGYVKQKRYRAHRFKGAWVVETDHDFKNFPGNVMYVHPYEIELDDQDHIARIQQRMYYLGSPSVYRQTWASTLRKQKSVPNGMNSFHEVLEHNLHVAFAKEQGKKPSHNSIQHYPNAVTEVRDKATGESYLVNSNGSKIFVQNPKGAVVKIIKVMSKIDLSQVAGTPVIRRLELRNGKLLVTVGNDTQIEVDR